MSKSTHLVRSWICPGFVVMIVHIAAFTLVWWPLMWLAALGWLQWARYNRHGFKAFVYPIFAYFLSVLYLPNAIATFSDFSMPMCFLFTFLMAAVSALPLSVSLWMSSKLPDHYAQYRMPFILMAMVLSYYFSAYVVQLVWFDWALLWVGSPWQTWLVAIPQALQAPFILIMLALLLLPRWRWITLCLLVSFTVIQPKFQPVTAYQEIQIVALKQTELKDIKQQNQRLARYITQTKPASSPQWIIWPEAVIHHHWQDYIPLLTKKLKLDQNKLLLGVHDDQFNAMVNLSDNKVLANKHALVPFSEQKVPFTNIGTQHFKAAAVKKPASKIEGVQVLSFICFDVSVHSNIHTQANQPSVIMQIGNESWANNDTVHRILEHMSLRHALTQGLALVRATADGYSGVYLDGKRLDNNQVPLRLFGQWSLGWYWHN